MRNARHGAATGTGPAARAAAALVAVAALAWPVPGGPRSSRADASPERGIEAMSALAAADSADRLIAGERYIEAIPFIERVERGSGPMDAAFERRAATTESNACFQVRGVRGLVIPATRSSIERVALMTHVLLRLERGERQAPPLPQKRDLIADRGRMLAVWGFPREGYAEMRRAHQVLPLDRERMGDLRWIETGLRRLSGAGAGEPAR